MHNLTSGGMAGYLLSRFTSSPYPFRTEFTKDGEGVILVSTVGRSRRSITLRPKLTPGKPEVLEIAVEADIPQVQQADLGDFLGGLVQGDRVFQRDGALYSAERQEDLPRLRSILKRMDYPKGKGGLSCEVVDGKANNETLQKAMWDYMVKPALVALYKI